MSIFIDPSQPLPPGYEWGDTWSDDVAGECGRYIIRTHDRAKVRALYDLWPDHGSGLLDEAFNAELKKGEYPG